MKKNYTIGRDKFKKVKLIIAILVLILKLTPKSIRVFLWDFSNRYSQLFFIGLRYIILKSLIKSCGENVRIGDNVRIIYWENLSIGNNVSIHTNCYIDAYGQIEIGDNVSVAHHTSLISSNHTWDIQEIPIKYNPVITAPIIIEDDVWIGAGCKILSNTHIGSRSILAAGAVLNKNMQKKSIFGGVPAKLIKNI